VTITSVLVPRAANAISTSVGRSGLVAMKKSTESGSACPGSNASEFHFAAVPRALVEPACREQKDLAARVLGVAPVGGPPFAYLLGE